MTFTPGIRVIKTTGDYRFEGIVVSVFKKRSGEIRFVVENDEGLLLILNQKQLRAKEHATTDVRNEEETKEKT